MPVIIDPLRIDLGALQHQHLAFVDRVLRGAGGGETPAEFADHGTGRVIRRAQRREHRDQAIVAQSLQLADRLAGGLVVGLARDGLDQLIGELRSDQLGPGQLQRRAELVQEMPHARLAAGHAIDQERAHERPAQTRAVADRIVDLGRGRDARH